jgi:uncharacterized Tic20 family protein
MDQFNQNNSHYALRTDNQLLLITHLSQLLTYITGFGGLLVPLIIWAVNRDKVAGLNEHGKEIINFQLTMILLAIICIPLILALGLGIIGLIVIGILSFVMPIVNGINASNGVFKPYPLTIKFIA